MKICAFVPAKGSSDRLPNKNLRILDGEYLFKRKLRQLLESRRVTEVWLDTESDELISLARDLPVRVLRRDPALADNRTDGHALFANEARGVPDADVVVQALCTGPFVDAAVVDRALDALLANPAHDSLVAVTRQAFYKWADGQPQYGRGRIPNSVDLDRETIEAMSLYAVRQSGTPAAHRFGRQPLLFELSPREAVDVNTGADLEFAEALCAGERAARIMHFKGLQGLLSSAMLADIGKELGLTTILPSSIRAVSKGRFLGFAKTLQLKALDPAGGDKRSGAWRGIFQALDSYAFIRPGDVIMVATGVPGKAYFGDLNATLALRHGAVGAVIDGATRDSERVEELGFPVYAQLTYGDDIRYEGTVEHMNLPVVIGGVTVRNNDVVFADRDGVAVVPHERWREVEQAARETVERESRVKISAALGMPPNDILAAHGDF